MIDGQAILIGGAILIVCIVVFWMWVSSRNKKRKLIQEENKLVNY